MYASYCKSNECWAAVTTLRNVARVSKKGRVCGKQENGWKAMKWSPEEKQECRGWFHLAMGVVVILILEKESAC